MNNSITEDYCSYEVSKLLKLKGFGKDNPSTEYIIMYDEDGNLTEKQEEDYDIDGYYLRPAHSVAIKWFRENFGIDIHAKRQYKRPFNVGEILEFKWVAMIDNLHGSGPAYYDSFGEFNAPEEATEAAILYVLKNLI